MNSKFVTSCYDINGSILTPMTWMFYATPNTPKSSTMQEILGENTHKE